MRTINVPIHPPSVLLGVLVLGLVQSLGSWGQFAKARGSAAATSESSTTLPTVVRVEGFPLPHQLVVIKEGEPLVVPEGKTFVLTGIGSTWNTRSHVGLKINGTIEVSSDRMLNASSSASWDTGSVSAVPLGLTAGPADVVEVGFFEGPPYFPSAEARAWGYLADRD